MTEASLDMAPKLSESGEKGVKATEQIYRCKECSTRIMSSADILSSQFTGQHGRAMLVSIVENTVKGPEETRLMRTGQYVCSNLFCAECMTELGWYYVSAAEVDQKYKEGNYILEKELLVKT